MRDKNIAMFNETMDICKCGSYEVNGKRISLKLSSADMSQAISMSPDMSQKIMDNDTFVCLGDVGSAKYLPEIKARKKILLLGNHDNRADYRDYFDEIYTGRYLLQTKYCCLMNRCMDCRGV